MRRLRCATETPEVITAGDRPTAVAIEERAIWIANGGDNQAWRVTTRRAA